MPPTGRRSQKAQNCGNLRNVIRGGYAPFSKQQDVKDLIYYATPAAKNLIIILNITADQFQDVTFFVMKKFARLQRRT